MPIPPSPILRTTRYSPTTDSGASSGSADLGTLAVRANAPVVAISGEHSPVGCFPPQISQDDATRSIVSDRRGAVISANGYSARRDERRSTELHRRVGGRLPGARAPLAARGAAGRRSVRRAL